MSMNSEDPSGNLAFSKVKSMRPQVYHGAVGLRLLGVLNCMGSKVRSSDVSNSYSLAIYWSVTKCFLVRAG